METEIRGHKYPRIRTKPLRPDEEWSDDNTFGLEAIEFAKEILEMDLVEWQEEFLCAVLEKDADRKALRFRVAFLIVGRQNGKSLIMTVLALYFMSIRFEGGLVLGTAQNLNISSGTWEGAVELCQSIPEIDEEIDHKHQGIIRQIGKQQLKFKNKSTWMVAPATRDGMRGKSARMVLLDELREHKNWEAWGAGASTTLSFDQSLILGVSSAGDDQSIVLKQQRDLAISEIDDPETQTAIFEWSTPESFDIDDPVGWAYANPSLNNKPSNMTIKGLRSIRKTAPDALWKTENLSQWVPNLGKGPWEEGVWDSKKDIRSKISKDSPVVVAFEASKKNTFSYIAIAGWNYDLNKVHVEIMSLGPGDAWVAPWLDERLEWLNPTHVVTQGPTGTPGALIAPLLEDKNIEVTFISGSQVHENATQFVKDVRDGAVVHIDQPCLNMAAATAGVKDTAGGNFMFDRNKSAIDISPLMAVAEAYFYLVHTPAPKFKSAYGEDYEMAVI